ncbi:MAG: RdgB/HAM1 family non-canonical purine NTP pyrophosphatase [Planctomycetota bacterium]
MDLLLASGNQKKLAELTRIVAGLGVRVLSPADVDALPEIDEDGATFEANALKKARGWAAASGLVCIADDSGLEVDALDGAPGVRSARYAGVHGDDHANNQKLLAALDGTPDSARGARFVCAIAVVDPSGATRCAARGTVEGRIVRAPRGADGFGYDPLFECHDEGLPAALRGRTFGELTHAEKALVSHRARALAQLRGDLAALAGERAQAQPGRERTTDGPTGRIGH